MSRAGAGLEVLWKGASEMVRIQCWALDVEALVVKSGTFDESGCLGMQPKMGGKVHLKLNTGARPIANKYSDGKMKRTLKRESKST